VDELRPTAFLDSDAPIVAAKARELTATADDDTDALRRIYTFVRDVPYDILAAFRYLARGERTASAVLVHGTAFCMGKASLQVALCRAAGIPARIAFQVLDCPDKEFLHPAVRAVWADRPLPWHSLGEARLGGRWLKLDATIDAATAAAHNRPYLREFDGVHDIPTVEGKIVRDNGSYLDYPAQVAAWYEKLAVAVVGAIDARRRLPDDDALWAGPPLSAVRAKV
jgi:transglutaminase-like putative cysteine protease